MANETQQPGPGRSTSRAAFDELRKEIAQRNEAAHKVARKLRTVREQADLLRRRQRDSR
jgi:hypothetical protein